MSDKSTTGEPFKHIMTLNEIADAEETKPTTGEWTVERVWQVLGQPTVSQPRLRQLTCEINAALAAEREQTDLWKRQAAFESEHREKYRQREMQLREQLAARDKEWRLEFQRFLLKQEGGDKHEHDK